MNRKLESVRQDGLQHFRLRLTGFHFRDNVESFRGEPIRPQDLGVGGSIGPSDARFQGYVVHPEQVAVSVDVGMSAAARIRFYRRHFEGLAG